MRGTVCDTEPTETADRPAYGIVALSCRLASHTGETASVDMPGSPDIPLKLPAHSPGPRKYDKEPVAKSGKCAPASGTLASADIPPYLSAHSPDPTPYDREAATCYGKHPRASDMLASADIPLIATDSQPLRDRTATVLRRSVVEACTPALADDRTATARARIVADAYTAASENTGYQFGRPALSRRPDRSDQGPHLRPRQRWDPRGILISVVGVRPRHESLARLDRSRHMFLPAETGPWAHLARGESHRPGLPRNY